MKTDFCDTYKHSIEFTFNEPRKAIILSVNWDTYEEIRTKLTNPIGRQINAVGLAWEQFRQMERELT